MPQGLAGRRGQLDEHAAAVMRVGPAQEDALLGHHLEPAQRCRRRHRRGDAQARDRHAQLGDLGLQQVEAPPGESRLVLPDVREELHNRLAAAHGGVLMTLLDVAMARAAISHPQAPSATVVTVEMSTRFLKPGTGALSVHGRVLSGGRSLCACEAHVHDAAGARVASAMGTFKYWRGSGGID